MAYIPQIKNDEEENQPGQGQAGAERVISQGAAPQLGLQSGGGSQGVNAGGGQAPSGSQTQSRRGSNYVNLQNYLNVNKGEGLGEQVKEGVKYHADQATEKLGGYRSNVEQAVDKGRVKSDQDVIQGLREDPTKVDEGKFKSLYYGEYGGPKHADEVEGYKDTRQAYGKVDEATKGAKGGFSERTNLLQTAFQRPDEGGQTRGYYTPGESRLDTFFLGASDAGQKALDDIANEYGEFGGQFDDYLKEARGTIEAADENSKAVRDNVRSEYDTALGSVDNVLSGIDPIQMQEDEYQQALGKSDDELAELAGVNPVVRDYLKNRGFDFKSLVGKTGAKKYGDYVSDADKNRYESLLGLLDRENTKYDFERSGAGAFEGKEDRGNTAEDLWGLENEFNRRYGAQKEHREAARQAEIERALTAFKEGDRGYFGNTGLNEDEISRLFGYSDIQDFSPFVQGTRFELGDVINEDERQRYRELSQALGLDPGEVWPDLNSEDDGGAYKWDTGALRGSLGEYPKNTTEQKPDWTDIPGVGDPIDPETGLPRSVTKPWMEDPGKLGPITPQNPPEQIEKDAKDAAKIVQDPRNLGPITPTRTPQELAEQHWNDHKNFVTNVVNNVINERWRGAFAVNHQGGLSVNPAWIGMNPANALRELENFRKEFETGIIGGSENDHRFRQGLLHSINHEMAKVKAMIPQLKLPTVEDAAKVVKSSGPIQAPVSPVQPVADKVDTWVEQKLGIKRPKWSR